MSQPSLAAGRSQSRKMQSKQTSYSRLLYQLVHEITSPTKNSFYISFAQASQVFLPGGVSHAQCRGNIRVTQDQRLLPRKLLYQLVHEITSQTKNSFYVLFAWSSQVWLLGGVNHAQRRTNKPLGIGDCCLGDCCTNHGPVRDVLEHCTSRASAWCARAPHITGQRVKC